MTNTIATTILQQLGGNKFLAMTGAKNLLADKNTLTMTLPINTSKSNRLSIKLDEALDLYEMSFSNFTPGRVNMKTFEWKSEKNVSIYGIDQVYCDQLQNIFTSITGMRTSL